MEQSINGPDFAGVIKQIKTENDIKNLNQEIAELQKIIESKDKSPKKEEVTLAQQLLLLHYLGLLKQIDLSTKAKSILLSKVLNRSHDNIRKNITYIDSPKISHSKIKNVENLELILSIFQELNMTQVAEKVQVDLNKVKQI